MVKQKLFFMSVAIALIISSCSVDRFGYSNKRYGKGYRESFSLHMQMLVDGYTEIYGAFPESVEDLINYVDGMNQDAQLWYEREYDYLKRNDNKLLFVADSLVSVYYMKIKNRHLLLQASICSPCSHMHAAKAEFFNEHGHYFTLDSLSDYVDKRLRFEYGKYFQITKNTRSNGTTYERVILEYTPNRLKNLCTDETLDIDRSGFLKNAYDFLDSLARANNISRITAPCFIDKVAQD